MATESLMGDAHPTALTLPAAAAIVQCHFFTISQMSKQSRTQKSPKDLRSYRWFGPDDLRSFGHRSRIKQMGFGPEDYQGKPVVAILNTWSEFNTCHTH